MENVNRNDIISNYIMLHATDKKTHTDNEVSDICSKVLNADSANFILVLIKKLGMSQIIACI